MAVYEEGALLCRFPVILHGDGHLKDRREVKGRSTYVHLYNVMSSHKLLDKER